MNKQEAIKMLNEMLKHCEDELEFGLGDEIDDYTRKGIKVYELAISALEKQIPKKLNSDMGGYYCPSCKEWVDEIQVGKITHCTECGQKLNWEDEANLVRKVLDYQIEDSRIN